MNNLATQILSKDEIKRKQISIDTAKIIRANIVASHVVIDKEILAKFMEKKDV